ncbi:hypothetical protein SRIMM317S_05420 [Streptomyces rimosus subsp. rimosus]
MTGTRTVVTEEIRRTPPQIAMPSRTASSRPTAGANHPAPPPDTDPEATAVIVLDCTALKTKPKVTVMATANRTPGRRLPSPRCM